MSEYEGMRNSGHFVKKLKVKRAIVFDCMKIFKFCKRFLVTINIIIAISFDLFQLLFMIV